MKDGSVLKNIPKYKISKVLLYLVSVFAVFGFISLVKENLGFYLLNTGAAIICYLLSVNFIFLSRARKNVRMYLVFLSILIVLVLLGLGMFM